MLGFYGASRYCHPRYREGFGLECLAIRKVRKEMGLINVKVMIPFCRTIEEGYVLTVLLILWFSWNNRFVSWIGIFASVLMVVAFFMIHNNTDLAIALNRILAIITIWLAVILHRRMSIIVGGNCVSRHH